MKVLSCKDVVCEHDPKMLKSPPSLNPTDVVFNACAAKIALCASIILKILIKVSQRSIWLTLDEQFDQTILGYFYHMEQ